jgi:type IV pilus biogenesis protein CpaD/CtpE
MTPKVKVLLAAALLSLASCATTHTHSANYNGVPGLRGEAVEYQSTTKYAMHFLFVFGVFGDASQTASVDAFTEEASSRGAKRVHITQTESTTYWYIFPPLSFFIHPVAYTVYGEVEGTVVGGD